MGSKQNENIEEIKKNEEKYRTIIYNLTDVIVEMDSKGEILFVNPRYYDLFGYHTEEIIGQNAFDLVHPDDLPKVVQKMEEVIETGETVSFECRSRHKNGSYVYISARGGLFEDKGILKFVGIVRELSEEDKLLHQLRDLEDVKRDLEQKLQEKAITSKESEKKFRHLFETSPYAIILLNFEGNIIDCNSTTFNIFKYTKEDLIGKKFQELIAFPPETLDILQKSFDQLTKGQKLSPILIKGYTKDDETVWVNSTATLVRLYNEILIQVIAQEITKPKLTNKSNNQ